MITRRVRDAEVYSELVPFDIKIPDLLALNPKGIILSGGPASVYTKNAPTLDHEVFKLGIPVLGICYGLQLMTHQLGGKVEKANKREYGKTELIIDDSSDLFNGLSKSIRCWMSHGDRVKKLPPGFSPIAHSANSPVAAMRSGDKRLFAVQFHPEVTHTEHGQQILENFVQKIGGCQPSWTMESFVKQTINELKETVGSDRVLCALSGGVDSSTAAVLAHQAIGDRLTCVFVDHGLLRKREAENVIRIFKEHFKINLHRVDAAKNFLRKLRGVTNPEKKRKIIGEEFIRTFTAQGKKLGHFKWLLQGTLYPDVIESAKTGSVASRIKTHHNVAGLPGWMKFKLLEPLKWLYKDEVRRVAGIIGLPPEIVKRHPFPGPGLAVRIIGAITRDKLRICRDASAIVEEVLQQTGLYDRVWQAFAIVGDDKAVGVLGDERRVGHVVTVRVVESLDAMTADWSKLPHEVLERISSRITNEVDGVTMVTYAISSKPPATIEPC